MPGAIGSGIKGYETANDLQRFLTADQSDEPPPELVPTEAKIQYKLGTTVPENWILFIAVRQPGLYREIRLQCAAIPRLGSEKIITHRGIYSPTWTRSVCSETVFHSRGRGAEIQRRAIKIFSTNSMAGWTYLHLARTSKTCWARRSL